MKRTTYTAIFAEHVFEVTLFDAGAETRDMQVVPWVVGGSTVVGL